MRCEHWHRSGSLLPASQTGHAGLQASADGQDSWTLLHVEASACNSGRGEDSKSTQLLQHQRSKTDS